MEHQETQVTLPQILQAREDRARRQQELQEEHYGWPLICFTMNMAGPVKRTEASHRAFLWGMDTLVTALTQHKIEVITQSAESKITGDEGYLVVDGDDEEVKAICVDVEEIHPLGRLFDIDVLDMNGRKLERKTERSCLVCGKQGRGCASRRAHSVEELRTVTDKLLSDALFVYDEEQLASSVTRALLEEVAVTPKPGLVDLANSGAHEDMDFHTFFASAAALAPYWRRCFRIGHDTVGLDPAETFAQLRPAGKRAEWEMGLATGCVNTHKGMIFMMGVICGALGRLWDPGIWPPAKSDLMFEECVRMTLRVMRQEYRTLQGKTGGEKAYRSRKVLGIRGQVSNGFPAVRIFGLPLLKEQLEAGKSMNQACVAVLLRYIAQIGDTNLFKRGGGEGMDWAKDAVRTLIDASVPPTDKDLEELDKDFIFRKLSPGGCADLLAVTIFCHGFFPSTDASE